MTNLLFPTDFSTNTAAALDWVRLFAQKTGATITLLHVYLPIVPDTVFPSVTDPGIGMIETQQLEEISRNRLTELADLLQTEGLSVQTEWRIGLVDNETLAVAKEIRADLIVMGRSDLNTFFDRLAGSAVSDVADDAYCPVLIVPTTEGGVAVRPAQVHTIAYAMQPQTTQAQVTAQTEALVKTFDAFLTVLTEDKLDTVHADLIVMQLYPKSGFLDGLFQSNPVVDLIEKSEVPVLVYHEQK